MTKRIYKIPYHHKIHDKIKNTADICNLTYEIKVSHDYRLSINGKSYFAFYIYYRNKEELNLFKLLMA